MSVGEPITVQPGDMVTQLAVDKGLNPATTYAQIDTDGDGVPDRCKPANQAGGVGAEVRYGDGSVADPADTVQLWAEPTPSK